MGGLPAKVAVQSLAYYCTLATLECVAAAPQGAKNCENGKRQGAALPWLSP